MSYKEISDWLEDTPENIENWIQTGLKLGCEYLGMETGIISEINNDKYKIRSVYSSMGDIFSAGMEFDLINTYCEAVVKKNRVITYIQVGIIPEMVLHPVYAAVQLESYIGLPIYNKQNDIAGTLNFSSHKVKHDIFTIDDINLFRKMAERIQQQLYT